jgi:flagellar assembly factor FliW
MVVREEKSREDNVRGRFVHDDAVQQHKLCDFVVHEEHEEIVREKRVYGHCTRRGTNTGKASAMQIVTQRFGLLDIEPDDVVRFPQGLLGMEDCRHWVLLSHAPDDPVFWLQSTVRPSLALATVNPARFVPGYDLRLPRSELAPLRLESLADAQVLAVVARQPTLQYGMATTLNLKAPLVINVALRLGRQVVASGDAPLRYVLTPPAVPLRKVA